MNQSSKPDFLTVYRKWMSLQEQHYTELDKLNSLLRLFDCGLLAVITQPWPNIDPFAIYEVDNDMAQTSLLPIRRFESMHDLSRFAHNTMTRKNSHDK